MVKAPDSICILRLSALGDVTHVVPLIHTLQRFWPSTKITWVIGKFEYKLVGDLPGVEFITFDKRAGWRAFRDLYGQLRGRRFDVLLQMQLALRANLAGLAVRARQRIGYDRKRSMDLHSLFVNRRIPARQDQHVVDAFFSFLETAGLTQRELSWELPIPEADREFARLQLPDERRILIISACSSHPQRNWLAERYAKVADYAVEQHNMQVVLCGGPSQLEREMGAAIESAMHNAALNLVAKDTLKRMLALLQRASALISPDSGPAHMATCTNTPVIGLYVATDSARSGPFLSRKWCVDRYSQASEKFLGKAAAKLRWGAKIRAPQAMRLIDVASVCERLDAVLANAANEE